MPLALTLLLLTSIVSISAHEDRNLLGNLRDAHPYLEQLGKKMYIDGRSIKALDYISGYDNKIGIEPYPDDISDIKDAYVVINMHMIRKLKESDKKKEFPEGIENPPEKWAIIKELGKEEKNKVIIYYLP